MPSPASAKTSQRTTLPELNKRPTFLVHQLNAELARICNPLFRRLGVDLITSRILVILLEQQRAYIGDIVDLMALPQSTVSHQIKRLEEAGLVTRTPDKTDNRAYLATLTRKGRDIAVQCNHMSTALYAELFGDFDETQMKILVDTLESMAGRLRALQASSLNV